MTPWKRGLVGIALACGVLLGIGMIGRGGYEKPVFVPLEDARGGAISGRVVDGNGEPLAGLMLWMREREVVDVFQKFLPEDPIIVCRMGILDEVSDADGYFRFDQGAGRDWVVGLHPTEQLFEGQTGAIPVRPGFESSGITLRAQPFGLERLISGVVRGTDGSLVSGVRVAALSSTKRKTFLGDDVTDENGSFTIVAPTPTESAQLMAMPRNGSAVTLDGVRFGTSEFVIELSSDPFE